MAFLLGRSGFVRLLGPAGVFVWARSAVPSRDGTAANNLIDRAKTCLRIFVGFCGLSLRAFLANSKKVICLWLALCCMYLNIGLLYYNRTGKTTEPPSVPTENPGLAWKPIGHLERGSRCTVQPTSHGSPMLVGMFFFLGGDTAALRRQGW